MDTKNEFNAKYFFIGWIIAIIPYTLFLYMTNNIPKELIYMKYIMIGLLIIVLPINGYIVNKTVYKAKKNISLIN